MRARRFSAGRLGGAALAGAACMLVAAPVAWAQDAVPAPALSPHHRLDPGMPPLATRQAAQAERRTAQRNGAPSLNAQAEAQLRASFDAADTAHRGTLTRAQAQAGNFGFIAQHFDAIDTRHAGAVNFDDLKRYLQSRGARYISK